MRHMTMLGGTLQEQATNLSDQAQFISSDTDIKLFISEKRSERRKPIAQTLEQFTCSEDLMNYKNELANKQILEAGFNEKLKKNEENEAQVVSQYENMKPEERARKMLYRLCFEGTDLTDSEK